MQGAKLVPMNEMVDAVTVNRKAKDTLCELVGRQADHCSLDA